MASGFLDRFKGRIKTAALYLDSALGKGVLLNAGSSYVQAANVWTNAGAPSNGTGGTLPNIGAHGSLGSDWRLARFQNVFSAKDVVGG